jgi:hypothetical protein
MRDCANPDKQQLNSRPANATADLEGGEFFPSIAISLRDFEIHRGTHAYRGRQESNYRRQTPQRDY